MEEQGGFNIPPEYLKFSGESFPTYFDFMPEDGEELIPGVSIGEEKVEMFMQELYKELNTSAGSDISFDDVIPPRTTESMQSFMLKRWERSESCGAAVSESSSTVMAGVEFAGKLVTAPARSGGRCGCKRGSYGELVAVDAGNGEGGEIDGCGGCGARGESEMDGEDEEEWLSKVMNWGPADLVPGFWSDVHCVGGGASKEDFADERLDQVE